jgi:hypothetical protein
MLTNAKLFLSKRSNGVYYIGIFEGNRDNGRAPNAGTDPMHCSTSAASKALRMRRTELRLLSVLFSRYEALHGTSIRSSRLETYRLAVRHFKEACGDRFIGQYSILGIEKFKCSPSESADR